MAGLVESNAMFGRCLVRLILNRQHEPYVRKTTLAGEQHEYVRAQHIASPNPELSLYLVLSTS